jgi:hypothetical protein
MKNIDNNYIIKDYRWKATWVHQNASYFTMGFIRFWVNLEKIYLMKLIDHLVNGDQLLRTMNFKHYKKHKLWNFLFSIIVSFFRLFYVIFGYCKLFHFKLLVTIISYFILGYFLLCEVIIGYFWLLKGISRYVIIGNSRLL